MSTSRDRIVVTDPCAQPNPALVVAAVRAGALGVLDLVVDDPDLARTAAGLAAITRRTGGGFAVRCPREVAVTHEVPLPDEVHTVILTGPPTGSPAGIGDRRVLAEVVSLSEAHAALEAGAAGLVAKGCECGGRVGEVESFVLAQQVAELGVPFWVQGGLGEHTAVTAIVGGAAGVVLAGQLALARESSLDQDARAAVALMDGSETRVLAGYRYFVRPDLPSAAVDPSSTSDQVAARLGPDMRRDLVPLGQDAAASATRYGTVGGAVQAYRSAIDRHLALAAEHEPLAPGRGLAATFGIRHPVAQGPMTRVSDRAELAAAVAEAGGLPFLALALLPGAEVRRLLTQTAALLGDRPWGVGVLGFVPAEVRAAQLEVIRDVRPPAALIAGGRPAQAKPLDEAGIVTYLHVPSPGLLDRFLREGARRFVFEGRECGGHVGPRASLPLWEAQIERLLRLDDLDQLEVLFAGGIHDARSAAMVAAAAAPLAARGARIGVLMGTAYLFTSEAVATGAITPTFQQVAQDCQATVLLETSPGHATRCVATDYVQAFAARKAELEAAGSAPDEMWAELEALNLGRLRVASKGVARHGDELVELDETAQKRDGMYMLGQVATLRRECGSIADLHHEVTAGATARVATHAAAAENGEDSFRSEEPARPCDVAIVGMAAMFPGAVDVEQYWANVLGGVDCVTEVPADRWSADTFYDPEAVTKDAGRRTPSRWGGFLPWVPFDALAYGIPPRSLASIESVQLLSLAVADSALADAGYGDRAFDRSRTSVIFGAEGGNDLSGAYGFRAGYPHFVGALPAELDQFLPAPTEDSFPGVLTNIIAGRIANRLDLGGTNYTVDAACAASLAALDLACKELTTGSSDMVLCGAADVHNGINDYLLFASVHALSPSGECRTFDARADGIALGEGVACLVLKRLVDAERDGDRVYAVIDGVGSSSDGRHLGLTAPRQEGQALALERAYQRAGVDPSAVGLVEAHGTGTVVGDRTELATITEMFSAAGAAPASTVLGSVKSQIGHTKCAAGLAGVIKAARGLHAGVLPPTRNIERPNEYYQAETSPFVFLDRPVPWPASERRAGVSAFGFGGTNFHAVLRSHPDDERPRHGLEVWPAELFLIRGRSAEEGTERVAELRRLVERILADDPDGHFHRLRDLACTVSSEGRGPVQRAVVAGDLPDLHAKLAASMPSNGDGEGVFAAGRSDRATPHVAFLYPGQGSQRPGMLGDLFVTFPHLQSLLAGRERWAGAMFPPAAHTADERRAQVEALTDTRVAQPALGIASLAVTRLLADLGVVPQAAAGHSFGELAALATAGVFDKSLLPELGAARGEAMVAAAAALGDDPGAMAAVNLPAGELVGRLSDGVVVANSNGPRQTVVSGPTRAIEAMTAALSAERVGVKRLDVGAAFHSPLVAGACEALAARLAEVPVRAPALPVWSNVTADRYPADEDEIRRLVAEQLRQPVRFVDQIEAMYAAGTSVFVEVGPGRVLTQLVGRILADRPHLAVAVPGDPGLHSLLLALGALAVAGVPLDPAPLFAQRARRLDLAALPRPVPGWRLNGHLVCTRDGEPVPGGLQPADRVPDVPAAAPRAGSDDVVREYLRTTQEVMLRYLGEEVPSPPTLPAANGNGHGHNGSRPRAAANGGGGNGRAVEPSPEPIDRPDIAATRPRGDDLLATIVAIVGEQTGYPLDMLDPDLDLEADLSIDSIKRMEIVGELADRVGLPGMAAGAGLDEAVVEELAGLKTLRAIVAWMDDHAADATSPPAEPPAAVTAPVGETQRYELHSVRLPPALPTASLVDRTAVVVTDAWDGLDELRRRLEQAGVATVDVVPTHRGAPLSSLPDDVTALLAGADVVVHLGAIDPAEPVDARDVFAALRPAVTGRASTVVAAVPPRCGPAGSRPSERTSGVGGLMRSLARELPDRHVRVVELASADPPDVSARHLADEILDPRGPASVAYHDGIRSTRRLGPGAGLHRDAPLLPLDHESTVVVTGGARGITARAVLALARTTGCRLVLLGRSPLPDDEDPSTARVPDRPGLRRALLDGGGLRTPAEVEAACDRILAAREIRATLTALEDLGVPATYRSVDVRDSAALGQLLKEVRAEHGRIDVIVHAAGVLDDRLARDKTEESFDRVFATKVDAARTLLLDADPDVRLVVFFGSVSGVFGNRGQVDYSAANDALDELAARFDGCDGRRVLSIDWGPWAAAADDPNPGMVSPELAREYARRGIGLVDPDDGVAALLHELASAPGSPAQVVVMRADPAALEEPLEPTGPDDPPAIASGRLDRPGVTLEELTSRG